MSVFKGYHPIVNLAYIAFVIAFSIFCMHPICVWINLICSVFYLCIIRKIKGVFLIPLIAILATTYPLHNHEGFTILAYFPDGNPFTLESVVYGLVRAISVSNLICWFIFFINVMTTDKLMYIFGRLSPSASLVFSMILRFVPRFLAQTKKVVTAQRGLGRDIYSGNIVKRAKIALSVFSIMITWSAENSIDISDSMKARGYGVVRRTSFSPYIFCKRDMYAFTVIVILGLFDFWLLSSHKISWHYFPSIYFSTGQAYFFIVYFILCMIPAIMEIYGHLKMSLK